jgi:hypothetical protein
MIGQTPQGSDSGDNSSMPMQGLMPTPPLANEVGDAGAIHDGLQPDGLQPSAPREIGGRVGPEPTRFGDWEKNGRCIDF